MSLKIISVAKDYTRFPAGRYTTDGPFSGERFRQEWLEPALRANDTLEVDLDGVVGYGSSFLDEAFGGLVRGKVLTAADADRRIHLRAADASLVEEIRSYMQAS